MNAPKRTTTFCAALVAMCFAAGAPAKTIRVPTIAAADAPKIDGALDDDCWKSAAVADGFLLEETAAPPSQPTTAYFLCDGKRLYVGVRCAETDPAGMKMEATAEKGGVWSDDFLEIHVDVTNGKRAFGQLGVNPAGIRTEDALGKHAQIAAQRGDAEWRLEMALDLADLGVWHLGAPVRWALNLGRARHNRGAAEEVSVWNGAPGDVDDAPRMGEMVVGPDGEVVVEGVEIGEARWGAGNELSLRLTNLGLTQTVAVAAKPISASDEEREQRVESKLAPGRGRAVRGLFAISSLEAEQRLGLSLIDRSGRMLYRLWRPVEVRPLLSVQPLKPRYRGLVMPGLDQCELLAELGLTPEALAGATVEMQVRAGAWSGPTRLLSRLATEGERAAGREKAPDLPRDEEVMYGSFTPRTPQNLLTIPARTLPSGELGVRVRCLTADGRLLAEASMPLRRLTPTQAAALPAYVDEHNRLIVDGRPFFPLGWYGGHNLAHLEEIADSPFNCLLDYGINSLPLDRIREYLDAAQAHGLKLIYCMNDLYPAATYHQQVGPWTGNEDMARGVVSTFRDHPAVLAWYLNDELPREMIPDLLRYYDLVRATDPGHPTFIVHFVRDILADYLPTTDLLGIDVYPVPSRRLTQVSDMTDAGMAATQGLKPVWMVLQAFAWYQYNPPEDPNATGGRGRQPTENELRAGRAPTRDEERCMTYLALTHGAMGLIYYCYYDLRVLPQYQQMWGWMKEIGAEVKELSPVLLSPGKLPVEVGGDSEKIHALLKQHAGKWYLLAVNGESTPARAEFTLPGAAEAVRVMFEDHAAAVNGRALADDFAPYAAHVYEITPAAAAPGEEQTTVEEPESPG